MLFLVQAGYCTKNVSHDFPSFSVHSQQNHLGKICSQVFMVLVQMMGHLLVLTLCSDYTTFHFGGT